MAPLLGADAPLAGYLRGLYAWTAAVTGAIVDLAAGLRALDADWASTRARLDDARGHHRADLESAIRADLARVALRASWLASALRAVDDAHRVTRSRATSSQRASERAVRSDVPDAPIHDPIA